MSTVVRPAVSPLDASNPHKHIEAATSTGQTARIAAKMHSYVLSNILELSSPFYVHRTHKLRVFPGWSEQHTPPPLRSVGGTITKPQIAS